MFTYLPKVSFSYSSQVPLEAMEIMHCSLINYPLCQRISLYTSIVICWKLQMYWHWQTAGSTFFYMIVAHLNRSVFTTNQFENISSITVSKFVFFIFLNVFLHLMQKWFPWKKHSPTKE